MTCGIYRITNTVTGDFYVGRSKNIESRWLGGHLRLLAKGTHSNLKMQKLYDQTGRESFVLDILHVCPTYEESVSLEWKIIQSLNPSLNQPDCDRVDVIPMPDCDRSAESFGLRDLRIRAGLKTVDVACLLHKSEATIRNWDTGRQVPTVEILELPLMLQVYQCTLEELVEAATQTRNFYLKTRGMQSAG